jgi:hypothetical protein
LIYIFDLSPAIGLTTSPGIPVKLYPQKQSKMSTFATFIPEASDGYFSHLVNSNDDDDEQHKEPLLWAGAEDEVSADIILEVETEQNGYLHVKVRAWWNGVDELEPVTTTLYPNKHSRSKSIDDTNTSIKDVIMHYYRNNRCGSCYGQLEEMYEYGRTAVVGYLSPFALLGIFFLVIVIGVFALSDLISAIHKRRHIQLANGSSNEKESVV